MCLGGDNIESFLWKAYPCSSAFELSKVSESKAGNVYRELRVSIRETRTVCWGAGLAGTQFLRNMKFTVGVAPRVQTESLPRDDIRWIVSMESVL